MPLINSKRLNQDENNYLFMPVKNPHLLLIDDNEDILFMLKAMFEFKGYQVTVKDNVDNIEGCVTQVLPDVILMDMLLSGANGCELSKQIKANPVISSIPIVMMSAMPNADIVCIEAGADYFIGKPFEMESMLNIVTVALSAKEKAILA